MSPGEILVSIAGIFAIVLVIGMILNYKKDIFSMENVPVTNVYQDATKPVDRHRVLNSIRKSVGNDMALEIMGDLEEAGIGFIDKGIEPVDSSERV